MFERRNEPLLPTHHFIIRLIYNVFFGIILILAALFMGSVGYHFYEQMSWVDAFANASMILSGMGPMSPLKTESGKLFAAFYALFSGLFFILTMAVIFAPVIHRFFHKFHLESETDSP